MAGLCFCFLLLFYFFPSPPIRSGEAFSSVIFSSLSLLLFVFFGCSDGMEREACVDDHGFERSDLMCGNNNNNNNNNHVCSCSTGSVFGKDFYSLVFHLYRASIKYFGL